MMSQTTTFEDKPEELRRSAEKISQEALSLVSGYYGDGLDGGIHKEIGSTPKAYHNGEHTQYVDDKAAMMARALDLSEYDQAILGMAASAHDLIHGKKRGDMERESAGWLEDKMVQAGFPEEDVEAARLAVLGTEPIIQDGRLVGQKVSRQKYPSERAETIAMCLASADLAGLYDPLGPRKCRYLYLERQGMPADQIPVMGAELLAFQEEQIWLLENYQFPHPKATELFGRFKDKILSYQTDILSRLKSHEIVSWAELLKQDMAFANILTSS